MNAVLMTGLDYSAGTIPGAAIKAAGYQFVVRYVEDPKQWLGSKHIRPAEYVDLIGAGLEVFLVFEIGVDDMLGGYAAGVANATRAQAGATWIGYPPAYPIFMACDMHLTTPQIATALEYIAGAATVLGDSLGVYGFVELIDAAANGPATYLWQCGHRPTGDNVHVWQRNDIGFASVGGIECDTNELYLDMPTSDGNEVALTADEHSMLVAVYQYVSGSATVVPDGTPWPGWPTWPGGTEENLTATDLLRRANVQMAALLAAIETLKSGLEKP
jgi:Domain of unknown function (DUF1906)